MVESSDWDNSVGGSIPVVSADISSGKPKRGAEKALDDCSAASFNPQWNLLV